MVEAPALEHRPRCVGQRAAVEKLERMQDGCRGDLEEDVPEALLGQVEGLPRAEHALVEGGQPVEIIAQKRHVPSTSFTGSP